MGSYKKNPGGGGALSICTYGEVSPMFFELESYQK